MIEQIRVDAIQFAVASGAVTKSSKNPDEAIFHHLSISLNPCPYPVKIYNQVMGMQKSIGVLYAALCLKQEDTIKILSNCDDVFIQKLIEVAVKAKQSEFYQPVHLGKLRSDFMIDKRSSAPKLVEYNTISAGMGCLWDQVKHLQRYIQKKYEILRPCTNETSSEIEGSNHLFSNCHSE